MFARNDDGNPVELMLVHDDTTPDDNGDCHDDHGTVEHMEWEGCSLDYHIHEKPMVGLAIGQEFLLIPFAQYSVEDEEFPVCVEYV